MSCAEEFSAWSELILICMLQIYSGILHWCRTSTSTFASWNVCISNSCQGYGPIFWSSLGISWPKLWTPACPYPERVRIIANLYGKWKCFCAHSVIIICRCPTSSLDYSSWLLLKRLEWVLFTLALEQSVHLGHSMCQTMWWRPKGGPLKRLSGNSAQLSSLELQVYPTKSVNNISTATQKCFIWHIESGSRSDSVAVWWDCAAFAPVLVLAVF